MSKLIEQNLDLYNNYDYAEWKKIWFNRKTGGFVVMHNKHEVAEMGDNISIANILTALGLQIQLMPVIDKQNYKSYDAKINNENWEFKTNIKNTASAIDNEIRTAKEQANNIVLNIKSKINIQTLESAVFNRINRSKNIKKLIIIYESQIYQFNRNEIINKTFKGKIKKQNIKKGV